MKCAKQQWNFAKYIYEQVLNWQKTAYIFHDLKISYEDLKSASQRMAKSFMDMGIKPGQRVLLFLNDNPAFISAFLAAAQVGAIPVPLNPKSKKASLEHYIESSQPVLLIIETESAEFLNEVDECWLENVKVIQQDLFGEKKCADIKYIKESDSFSYKQCLLNACWEDYYYLEVGDPVFWQYTSGTTGKAKAVMHDAYGMIEQTKSYTKKTLSVDPSDIFYSTAKLFFGYGLGNSFFFPLLNNATAVLDDRWPTPENVCGNILSHHPTLIFSVPAIYNPLLEFDDKLSTSLSDNTRFVSAGSPLPNATFKSWKYRYGVMILDGIGSTEMGHIYLTNTLDNTEINTLQTVVDGFDVKLVDENGSEDNPDRGVLYVSGPSMSKGYYQPSIESAAKFADGWYRTGDIFKKDANGGYCFEGREDDLFKVNGRWVSPLDVEDFVLSNFCKVNECVLVKGIDDNGNDTPELYVVADIKMESLDEFTLEIKELIAEAFGSYCAPSACYVLPELPRNDNGKVLRHMLTSQTASATEDESKKGSTEEICV